MELRRTIFLFSLHCARFCACLINNVYTMNKIFKAVLFFVLFIQWKYEDGIKIIPKSLRLLYEYDEFFYSVFPNPLIYPVCHSLVLGCYNSRKTQINVFYYFFSVQTIEYMPVHDKRHAKQTIKPLTGKSIPNPMVDGIERK